MVVIPKRLVGYEPKAKIHFPSLKHKKNKVKPMDVYSPKLPQNNSLDANTKVSTFLKSQLNDFHVRRGRVGQGEFCLHDKNNFSKQQHLQGCFSRVITDEY